MVPLSSIICFTFVGIKEEIETGFLGLKLFTQYQSRMKEWETSHLRINFKLYLDFVHMQLVTKIIFFYHFGFLHACFIAS